jgi:probable F420-dependent oxidoreductase
MKFGFYLPTRGDGTNSDSIAGLAIGGERLGFHSATFADHVVFPTKIESPYPYTVGGGFPGQGDAFEQLTMLSYIAGRTEKLRLVTSVMIVPHRNPVLTAKMLATIDVLSKGRVTVGAGVGWLREEFEALSTPDFDKRGAVTNEYLEIFKKLWTQDPVSHEGKFYSFKELRCMPHPVQKPHPPIWIGGHSKPALRRAARYGDGWHPVGSIAAVPLPPAELQKLVDELKRMTEAEGRDPDAMTICYKTPLYDPGMPVEGKDRKPFSGTAEQIADDIRGFQAVGVSEIVFDFRSPSLERSLEQMETFAKGVMPIVD